MAKSMKNDSFTNNPQLNLAEKAIRRCAGFYRRQFGEIERMQVKEGGVEDIAIASRKEFAKIFKEELSASEMPIFSSDAEAQNLPETGGYWLVSPVTSWVNFTHGREPTGMMVVFVQDGEAQCAMATYPLADMTYTALRSDGAQSTNARLRASGRKKIDGTLIASNGRGEDFLRKKATHLTERFETRTVSSTDMVHDILDAAGGKVDILVLEGLNSGESAFASLVLRESGSYATTAAGQPVKIGSENIIAANSKLHAVLTKTML